MAPVDSHLAPRDSNGCPSTLSGGAIAGIVLGSIAGTLIFIGLWRLLTLPGVWSSEGDVGYRPPVTRTRGRRRRRSAPSYVEYVEKPRSVSVSRRYHEDVMRPTQVYLS